MGEKDDFICLQCKNSINSKKDHYVTLSTHNMKTKPNDYVYFHANCWATYFNNKVSDKMIKMVENMQKSAVKLFDTPTLKGILSNIQGADIALNMLNVPLGKEKKEKEKKEKDVKRDSKDKEN